MPSGMFTPTIWNNSRNDPRPFEHPANPRGERYHSLNFRTAPTFPRHEHHIVKTCRWDDKFGIFWKISGTHDVMQKPTRWRALPQRPATDNQKENAAAYSHGFA